MRHWEFFFPLVPKGAQAKRFSRKSGVVYTPSQTRNALSEMRWLISKNFEGPPIEGPVLVEIELMILKPKSVSLKKRPFPIVKPDIDNALKIIFDAGNKLIWRDDAQIVNLHTIKRYGSPCGINLRVSGL